MKRTIIKIIIQIHKHFEYFVRNPIQLTNNIFVPLPPHKGTFYLNQPSHTNAKYFL